MLSWFAEAVRRPERSGKITTKMGPVDLGQLAPSVDEGFYAKRTDLIRTAIRCQLDRRTGAFRAPLEAASAARTV